MLVAALPAFAVLLNVENELRSERLGRARQVARQQVSLLDQSLGDILLGIADALADVARQPAIANLDPGCGPALDAIRAAAPLYSALSLVRADGTLVCSSGDATPGRELAETFPPTAARLTGLVVGGYAEWSPGNPALTLMRVWPATAGRPGGVVVAAVSLAWLSRRIGQPLQEPDLGVLIADGNGVVLVNLAAAAPAVGEKLPPKLLNLFDAPGPGTHLTQDSGGGSPAMQRITGFLPPAHEPYGLFVATAFNVRNLNLGLDAAADRGYVLLAVAVVLAVALALVGAQRYVRTPTTELLRAADRWAAGALDVRAELLPACPREFDELARAFNRMAEMLQHQRSELTGMNDALELRVAERTGALLTSNNRLQVEIAERELSEANLRQAQKLQAVGQLAAGIAHNFNNLLGAMLGSIELLQKRMAGGERSQLRLLEIAKAAVSRGSWLTSQLLAFSRKQPMVAASVNMAEAVAGVEALLRSTLGSATRIAVQVPPDLWAAMIDANQFHVAVLNLALNAREAMPDGGRLMITAANTTVAASDSRFHVPAGDYIQVDVADTGHGMASEVAARAFEPFFTTKVAGQSAGLGLSQVHGMVTQLGGAVTIDSRVGEGTCVSLLLPRSTVAPKRYAIDAALESRPALGRDRVVLLVDDDDEVREVTAGILEDVGYTVVAAADGLAALAALDGGERRVGLVIADYAMPGMTGLELLTAIRKRRPDMPMLLATGYADHQSLSGDGLEPDQIVRKPFRSAELLGRIELVLERQSMLAG